MTHRQYTEYFNIFKDCSWLLPNDIRSLPYGHQEGTFWLSVGEFFGATRRYRYLLISKKQEK